MKTPAMMTNACLVLSVATMATIPTGADARPMHAGIDYERYLQEKDDIMDELNAWMDKWKDAAQVNGWLPKVEARSADDVDEDHKQRFFMAKQLVKDLKQKNPNAEFSTDSPFTLLTTDEFSKYIKNAFIAGGGRSLREEADTPTPSVNTRDINFNNWWGSFNWPSMWRPSAAPVAPTAAPARPVPKPTSTPNPNLPVAPTYDPTDAPVDVPSATAAPTPEVGGDGNSVDWSTGKCMPPIQNQGQCGACWSFASVAAVEASQCIAAGAGATFTKYSEQMLASCDTRVNQGCNGGVPQYALQYIQQNGLCTLAEDPYTSSNGRLAACNTACARVKTGMKGAQALAQNEAALLKALDTHPVVVAVQAGNDAWKQYKSGVLSACPSASAQVDHAVVAVGYDATTIKIRNSWGPRWGENGYIRVTRSSSGLGTCKILQQMTHATF